MLTNSHVPARTNRSQPDLDRVRVKRPLRLWQSRGVPASPGSGPHAEAPAADHSARANGSSAAGLEVSSAGSLRALIVCDTASARYGGEAILPIHYLRVLRSRGHDVWLVTHARTRVELEDLLPGETRIHYVEDSALHRLMWRLGLHLPTRFAYFTTGLVSRLAAQFTQRGIVRRLVATEGIDIVHQPMPVSPLEPSLMYDLGAPVIIGPMNGGMDYPPGFRRQRGLHERAMMHIGRASATFLNWLIPGKRKASLLLVANARTREALPHGVCTNVQELTENGVDLELWTLPAQPRPPVAEVTRFAFVGRLLGLKAVDLLIEAFAIARQHAPMRLVIVGDGEARRDLERLAASLLPVGAPGAETPVRFTGWVPQIECAGELARADCLVMPSLHDCGGAVVLEAMAMGKPVIATAWGGPLDYLDASCGVLIEPAGRAALVEGLAHAMVRLANAPAERDAMGRAARQKVERHYDWEVKADRVVHLYRDVIAAEQAGAIVAPN